MYIGPGTINFEYNALIGTDNNGIIYMPYGFATPFINIGPDQTDNSGTIGGWQIGPTGTIGTDNYDLIAQQKLPSIGLTGPIHSLINHALPVNIITANNLSAVGATGTSFNISEKGYTYIINSGATGANENHLINTGTLGNNDTGFYVNLRNGNNAGDITLYHNGTLVNSISNESKLYSFTTKNNVAGSILYWNGSDYHLY
jgi:hypothetical protein